MYIKQLNALKNGKKDVKKSAKFIDFHYLHSKRSRTPFTNRKQTKKTHAESF